MSHLFFADDSLLFCKASEHDCCKLIEILQLYEAASGQKVNDEKSSVIFSHNTPEESKRMVLDILGPMQDTRLGKYLGLPSIIGRSKTEVFAEVKGKGGKKVGGVERKVVVHWRKGDFDKSRGASGPYLYYELFSHSKRVV